MAGGSQNVNLSNFEFESFSSPFRVIRSTAERLANL